MSVLKWIILLMASAVIGQNFLTNISPGVYVEEWGEAAVIEKQAQIWIKLDITQLWEEIGRIEQFQLRVKTSCTRAFTMTNDLNSIGQQTDCDSFNMISTHMIENLKIKFERLWAESERRKKRGTLNIVGSGVKFLFGTMDEEDRVQILNKLDSLSNDNLNNIKFNFEYAKLIEKTVANVNTSIEICNRNGKLLSLLDDKMVEIAYHQDYVERSIKFFNFIKDLQQIFYLMNTETTDKISELHQVLIDLHNNVFNTKLYGYKDIIGALKDLTISDKNLELPISLTQPNLAILRTLIKYSLVTKENCYYIIYSLPLIEIEKLNLNKLYPIPEIENNIASYLDFNAEYILTNRHFDRFQLWRKSDLVENCVKYESIHYCKNLQLLRNDKESCAVRLMTENFKNLKTICNIRVAKLNEHLFIKTRYASSYISLAPSTETGTLVTGKSVRNLKFEGAQMLTVLSNSLLSLETMQIKFFNNSDVVIKRQINLTSNFNFDIQEPLWQNITVPAFEKPQIIDSRQFSEAGMELKTLTSKAKNLIDSHNKTQAHDWMIYILAAMAIVLSLAVIAIAAVMMRKSNHEGLENGTEEVVLPDIVAERREGARIPGSSNSLPAL